MFPSNLEEVYHNHSVDIRIFQLKVGGSPQDDIKRIRAVRKILDEHV